MSGMERGRCPWGYPIGNAKCGAPVTTAVWYRVQRRTVWYCLNHAMREVWGGQAQYAPIAPRDAA